jgi:hypothetical protein
MMNFETILSLDTVYGGMGNHPGGNPPKKDPPTTTTTEQPKTNTPLGDACREGYTIAGAAIGGALQSESGGFLGLAVGGMVGAAIGGMVCPP